MTQYDPQTGVNNRFGTILANIKNRTVDDTVQTDIDMMKRIRERFGKHFPDVLAQNSTDPSNPTPSELSKNFIAVMKNNFIRPVLKQEGYSEANNSVKQSLIIAEDSAGNDIN